ncbi:hypothetical protein SGPA1_21222 [Streptomyces misionensis JCM 4497]
MAATAALVRGQGPARERAVGAERDRAVPRVSASAGARLARTGARTRRHRPARRLLPVAARSARAARATPGAGVHRARHDGSAGRARGVRRAVRPALGEPAPGAAAPAGHRGPAAFRGGPRRPRARGSATAAAGRRAVQHLAGVRRRVHPEAVPPHPAGRQPGPGGVGGPGRAGLHPGARAGGLVHHHRAAPGHAGGAPAVPAGRRRRLDAGAGRARGGRRLRRRGPGAGPGDGRGASGAGRGVPAGRPRRERPYRRGDVRAPGRGRPRGAGAEAVRPRTAGRVRGAGHLRHRAARPAHPRRSAPRAGAAGRPRLVRHRLRGRAVPAADRAAGPAVPGAGRGRDAALLRLRGPAAPPLATRVGAPLPGGVLRGLRGPRGLGPTQEARAAARARDGQGGVRGAVRGETPAGLAAGTDGRDQTTRSVGRLTAWHCATPRVPRPRVRLRPRPSWTRRTGTGCSAGRTTTRTPCWAPIRCRAAPCSGRCAPTRGR